MTFGHKSLKPLRFLSLSLAIGLGGVIFAQSAVAGITSNQKSCVDEFAKELKKFSKTDVAKLEPSGLCLASEGADNNKAEDPAQRKKLKLGQSGETGTSFPGACASSYEAVQLVFKNLLESRKEVCEKIYTKLDEDFPECLSNKPPESCKDQIKAMADVYTNGKQQLQKDIDSAVKFLEKYPGYNRDAKNKFKDDLDELQTILRTQGRQELLTAPATPPDARRQVIAATQGSATLGDYLAKLEIRKSAVRATASRVSGGQPSLSPIDEQEEARKFVTSFSDKLMSLKAKEDKEFTHQLAAFREGVEKKLDTPNGTVDKVTKIAPVAAPFASSLLANNGADAASSIAGSSGALPALAAVGAAGAAGIAMGQKSAASSGFGSSPGNVGPMITPGNKATGTEFGNQQDNQAPAPLPASPLASTDSDKEEKTAAANTAAANGALAAALGGGASLMPGKGKAKSNREVASGGAPSTAGEEALKPFTGDLRPAPRPAASPDNTGNDVSSLLGKMKDLFNMDEPFGGDLPPPDMSAGGPGASPASGAPHGGDEYTGDDYSGGEEYHAGEDYSGEEEAYQGSNPMGDIEVTLFRRVHARHVKCIEKGLVLLMSQELPE